MILTKSPFIHTDPHTSELIAINRRLTRWRRLACLERDQWRECAKKLADALDYYHPGLRGVEEGFSAEREAIAEFDRLTKETTHEK
jgi:hypothetical protein